MKTFLEWLFNEDPDHLSVDGEYIDRFEDSISFFCMGGLAIYSKGFNVMHRNMILWLRGCEDLIRAASEGGSDTKGIVDCLKRYESLNVVGNVDSASIKIMVSLLDLLEELGIEENQLGRNVVLRQVPDLIWGRMWPKLNVVSFWNRAADLLRNNEYIFDFMRLMEEKENEFRYEVEGKLLTHSEFKLGVPVYSHSFDTSKLHTMPPGKAKEFIRKGLGKTRTIPRVDLSTKLKSYTGD